MRICCHRLANLNFGIWTHWHFLSIRHFISNLANIYLSCVRRSRNPVEAMMIRLIHLVLRKRALFWVLPLQLFLVSFFSINLRKILVMNWKIKMPLNLEVISILLEKLLSMHHLHIVHKELLWSNDKSIIFSRPTSYNFDIDCWHYELFQEFK